MRHEQVFIWVATCLAVAAVLPAAAKLTEERTGKRVAKQIHLKPALVDSASDHKAAETGFGGAELGGHGKYFQYQHNPEHDHYEFGYRRGNDHHFQERYEKAAPHQGHFKTKARWGDKHGGYGEHYWDYNHAGHGDDHGEDGDGGYSEHVPSYQPQQHKVTAKRDSQQLQAGEQRLKRQPPQAPRLVFDVASGQVVDETTGQAYTLQPVQ
ncbi:uncharacterized protein LOC134528821 [Bacillus rossius redtenbacheri]|uniref:uncharacterized protein LOC134528821 n=1 Tax=Bacillus rossius redtenbacheri TaxID=93214 RepID=UPI002FDCD636